MAAINFPSSPSVNDVYSVGTSSWIWDGTTWTPIFNGVRIQAVTTLPTTPDPTVLYIITE